MSGRMIRRLLVGGVLAIAISAGSVTPAWAGATVFKNGDVGCFTDPGDIPGMPSFALPEATLVLLPNGGVVLSCRGWLPAGSSVDRTFTGSAPCRAPSGEVVEAHVVATTSGRVVFSCRFPPGTF